MPWGKSVRRDLLRKKGLLVCKFHNFVLLLFPMIELEENPLNEFWGWECNSKKEMVALKKSPTNHVLFYKPIFQS